MIRVVLDTNIVVSALLQPLGPPAQVVVLALNGSMQLCVSGNVYAEYEEVVRRGKFQRAVDTVAAMLGAIRDRAFWVKVTETVQACSDADDNIFLECAQASQADYLVTGNLKHFPTSRAGTRVVTARWLLDILSNGTDKASPE